MNCLAKDCTNTVHSNALCAKHYMAAYRIRKSGSTKSGLDPAIELGVQKRHGAYAHCTKCNSPKIHGKGLCGTHYAQMLRARNKQNASV